jgi:hypothetical protein
VSRFQFVEDQQGASGVKRLCLVLKVSALVSTGG